MFANSALYSPVTEIKATTRLFIMTVDYKPGIKVRTRDQFKSCDRLISSRIINEFLNAFL